VKSEPSVDPTATFDARRGLTTASFAPDDVIIARGLDEGLRVLLPSRLILVHLLGMLFVALLAALSHATPGADPHYRPDMGKPWLLFPPFSECLVGAAVLWWWPAISLRSLRLWELVHFTVMVAFYGWLRFELLAELAWTSRDPYTLVAFYGAVTLFSFITLILAYGVLIPNTKRRSLVGVAIITTVPFATVIAASALNVQFRTQHFLPLLVQTATHLAFPAAIAVFVAARTTALQRRAFEAERRAERVGQYALKRKLGEGGMGEVWLAEHALLKRPCAVKFIRPELAAHPATAARFAREVQAVTALSHVNTVRVYDYGRADDGAFYYVMEYLDGPTLEQLVRDGGPLPPGRAVYLLRQVCGALAEAHAAGLVHRDLKPGNVIVAALGGQRDVAKLLDFGLVQDLSADPDTRLTRTGTVLGTPAFMSPEQAAGESEVDARSDIYSLGAVAFFALTGRPPFQRKGLGQVLAAHRAQKAPSLLDVRPDVPSDLAAAVARCLEKDTADRFPSARELDLALARCACGDDRRADAATAHASPAPRPDEVSGA
jgi:serine/threonine-protein kinase